MKRALVIPVEGAPYLTDIPDSGRSELAALHELVGGPIQLAPCPHPVSAFCNEEGKLFALPPNRLATEFCRPMLFPSDYIAGALVVLGPTDAEGETTAVPEAYVRAYFEAAGVPIRGYFEAAEASTTDQPPNQ